MLLIGAGSALADLGLSSFEIKMSLKGYGGGLS
jgi:hypothetical protein